jgi:hypothetical protein
MPVLTKRPRTQSQDMDEDEVVPHLAEKVGKDFVVEGSHRAPRPIHSVC